VNRRNTGACRMNPSFSKAWELGLDDYVNKLAIARKICCRMATPYDIGKKLRLENPLPCELSFVFVEYLELRWEMLFAG